MNFDEVTKFLNQHETCVLATVDSNGQPQAATVGFSHADDMSILIGTNKSSRKYQNLKNNSKVAIVVGFEGAVTFQYEGVAEEKDTEEISERIEKHFQKVPMAKKFAEESGQTWFIIKPTWLRYSDLANQNIHETTEFPA